MEVGEEGCFDLRRIGLFRCPANFSSMIVVTHLIFAMK
jgi:hypothetical protein